MNNKRELGGYKGELRKYLNGLKGELDNISTEKIAEIENKINLINIFYGNLFDGNESLEVKIKEIEGIVDKNESKYTDIDNYYSNLFKKDDSIKENVANLVIELEGYKEKYLEITNYYNEIFEGIDDNEAINYIIENAKNNIEEYRNKLFEGEESLEKKISSIILKIEDYEEKYNGIQEYYHKLLKGDDESESIKDKIQDIFNEIKKYKQELLEGIDGDKSIQEKINKAYSDFKEYYEYVFGKDEEVEDKDGKKTTKHIKGFKEKLDKLYEDKNTEYSELKKKIEGLLGSSTSAGLSSAYKKMKDSFETPKNIWSGVFIVSLGVVVFLGKDIKA